MPAAVVMPTTKTTARVSLIATAAALPAACIVVSLAIAVKYRQKRVLLIVSRRPAIITQTEIKQAVKAVVDAGVEVARVEVDIKDWPDRCIRWQAGRAAEQRKRIMG